MHIHLTENPCRSATCDVPSTAPMVSLETISEFSHMTGDMAETWLQSIDSPPHICGDVRYLPTSSIISWLTEQNQPPMPVNQAIDLLTAKLGPYLDNHTKPAFTQCDTRVALASAIKIDVALDAPCGSAIPIDRLFYFDI